MKANFLEFRKYDYVILILPLSRPEALLSTPCGYQVTCKDNHINRYIGGKPKRYVSILPKIGPLPLSAQPISDHSE